MTVAPLAILKKLPQNLSELELKLIEPSLTRVKSTPVSILIKLIGPAKNQKKLF